MESVSELRVFLDISGEVLFYSGFEAVISMNFIDALANIVEDLPGVSFDLELGGVFFGVVN